MLKVGDNLEGKFESSTPVKVFNLWITSEGDPSVKAPSGSRSSARQRCDSLNLLLWPLLPEKERRVLW